MLTESLIASAFSIAVSSPSSLQRATVRSPWPHEKTRPAKTERELTGVEWPVKVFRRVREGSSKSLISSPATTRVLSSGDSARQCIGSGLALKIEKGTILLQNPDKPK